jgi:hypothetical protein
MVAERIDPLELAPRATDPPVAPLDLAAFELLAESSPDVALVATCTVLDRPKDPRSKTVPRNRVVTEAMTYGARRPAFSRVNSPDFPESCPSELQERFASRFRDENDWDDYGLLAGTSGPSRPSCSDG